MQVLNQIVAGEKPLRFTFWIVYFLPAFCYFLIFQNDVETPAYWVGIFLASRIWNVPSETLPYSSTIILLMTIYVCYIVFAVTSVWRSATRHRDKEGSLYLPAKLIASFHLLSYFITFMSPFMNIANNRPLP